MKKHYFVINAIILEKIVLIFGNEARGLPEISANVEKVKIPMKGRAESFNVASAATIAMYEVGLR